MAGGRRVLIIEDDADSREALRSLLEVWGHEVEVAENGEQGIDLILTRRPEVVLLDIGMPSMNGHEVAHRIREALCGDVPYLVALTGWSRIEDDRRTREAGFDSYVLKPADPDQLQALVAAAPDGSATGRKRSGETLP